MGLVLKKGSFAPLKVAVDPPWDVPEGATIKKSHVWDKAEHDWYIEDEWVSQALFRDESFPGGQIWDPFCGTGRILDAASGHGLKTSGQDIVDRGAAKNHPVVIAKTDVLVMDFWHRNYYGSEWHIVTNPPYDLVN